MTNAGQISNSGLFDIKTDAGIQNGGGAVPSITNTGTWRKSASSGNTIIGVSSPVPFTNTNSGHIEVQTGTLQVNQMPSGTNSGTIDVSAGAAFSTNGNSLTNASGGV